MPFPAMTPVPPSQAPGPGTNAVAYGQQLQQSMDQAPQQLQAMQLANSLQAQLNPLTVQSQQLQNQNLSAQIPGTIADSFTKKFNASVQQGYGIDKAVQDKVTQHLSGLSDAAIKHASDLGFFLKTVAPSIDNYGPAKGQMLLQAGTQAGFSPDELAPYIRPEVNGEKLGSIGDSIITASKGVTEERLRQAMIGDQKMRVAKLETDTQKENTQTMAEAQKAVATIGALGRYKVAQLELQFAKPDVLWSRYSQMAMQLPVGSPQRKELESMAEYFRQADLQARGASAGVGLSGKADIGALGQGELKPMQNPSAAPLKIPPVQAQMPAIGESTPQIAPPGQPPQVSPQVRPSTAPTKADADRAQIYHQEYNDITNSLANMQKRPTETNEDFNARKTRTQADLEALTREMKANKIPLPQTAGNSKHPEGQLLYDPVNKTYAKIVNGKPVLVNAP